MTRVRLLFVIAACLIGFQIIGVTSAYAATPTVTLNWTAPTTAVDGTALTGAQVITKYEVFIATATIADTVSGAPTATVTTGTTTTQPVTASPGSKIFARVRACNASGCSVLSTEASATLPISAPNPPTNVTITLNIG